MTYRFWDDENNITLATDVPEDSAIYNSDSAELHCFSSSGQEDSDWFDITLKQAEFLASAWCDRNFNADKTFSRSTAYKHSLTAGLQAAYMSELCSV